MQNLDLKSLLVCLVKKCQGNIDATQEVQKINANHETLLRAVRIAFSDDEARDSLWVTYPLLIEQNPTEALALVKNSKDLDASTLSVARCVLANYINRDASTWQKNDNEILDTLLIATPPAEMLTIARIDIGLSELLKRGCEERITEFLAQFIIKHRDEHVRLTLFRRTLMTIRSQSSEVLGRFLTSCLLSGVVPLMRMSYDVIAVLPIEMKLRAAPDFKQIGEEQLTLFVFARRAIGWMVTNQDLCVSFVLDCVSKMSKETLKNFESDFYYLVCLNYPDLVKGELKIRRADCRKDYYKRIKKWLFVHDCGYSFAA